MKDHKNGNLGPSDRDHLIKDKHPGIQHLNDDDFHSERDLERINSTEEERNPNLPRNENKNPNDKNPNTPRNDNREDKDDEFDEGTDKNEDDYLKNNQKKQKQNPTSGYTAL